MNKLDELIESILNQIDTPDTKGEPAAVYEPMAYILELGGKRIRPAMVLAAYKLYKDEISQDVLDLALTVEMFHNFTLMHDDIMDNSPTRRGKASVHEKWDVPTAILSGDLMLIKVYDRLSRLNNKQIIKGFNRMAIALCEGQMMDMEFEKKETIINQDFLQMIEKKTAVLIAFSLAAGACLAGASQEDQDHLYKLGILLGVSFQLIDDYLDVFGDPLKTGKKHGGDIIEQKKTLLWNAMMIQLTKEQQHEVVLAKDQMPEDEYIALIKGKMIDLQTDQFVRNLAIQKHNEAFDMAEDLDINGDIDYLTEIMNLLSARQY